MVVSGFGAELGERFGVQDIRSGFKEQELSEIPASESEGSDHKHCFMKEPPVWTSGRGTQCYNKVYEYALSNAVKQRANFVCCRPEVQ